MEPQRGRICSKACGFVALLYPHTVESVGMGRFFEKGRFRRGGSFHGVVCMMGEEKWSNGLVTGSIALYLIWVQS